MNDIVRWNCFKWVLLFGLLQSFGASFFWWLSPLVMSVILFCIFSLYILLGVSFFQVSKKVLVWFLLLLSASFFTCFHSNFNGIIFSIVRVLPVFFVLSLKLEFKINFFNFFLKWFSRLLYVSLIGWLFYLLGIKLPYTMSNYGLIDGFSHYYYANYYLFIVNVKNPSVVPRFCSFFLEPGYLGCLLSVILFLNHYKFNGLTSSFWFGLFFSFSLAGWLLTIIGLLFLRIKNFRNSIIWFVLILIILFFGAKYIRTYNEGNNWVNIAFFSRLEYDPENGISGYNRSTKDLQDYFWKDYIYSSNLLFGKPNNVDQFSKGANADWKLYFIRYGLFAIVSYFLYLLYPIIKFTRNRYEIFILFIIYTVIFAQTIYGNFWLMYLCIYIIGSELIANRLDDMNPNNVILKNIKIC